MGLLWGLRKEEVLSHWKEGAYKLRPPWYNLNNGKSHEEVGSSLTYPILVVSGAAIFCTNRRFWTVFRDNPTQNELQSSNWTRHSQLWITLSHFRKKSQHTMWSWLKKVYAAKEILVPTVNTDLKLSSNFCLDPSKRVKAIWLVFFNVKNIISQECWKGSKISLIWCLSSILGGCSRK